MSLRLSAWLNNFGTCSSRVTIVCVVFTTVYQLVYQLDVM